MGRPDFRVQTDAPMSKTERQEWYFAQAARMAAQGAMYYRSSVDDVGNPKISLLEGWRVKPDALPPPEFCED